MNLYRVLFRNVSVFNVKARVDRRGPNRPVVKPCSPYPRCFLFKCSEWNPAFFLIFTTRVCLKTRLNGVKSTLFRKILKVLVYVFCSKRIDFRAILRNTLGTPVDSGLSWTVTNQAVLPARTWRTWTLDTNAVPASISRSAFRAALRWCCGDLHIHLRRSLMRTRTHKHSKHSAAQQQGARHQLSGLGGVQETYAILHI